MIPQHPRERGVFVRRNAVLLGLLAAIAAFASADVALGPQPRTPIILALMTLALALVLWNRIAPIRAGGVAHVPRPHPRRR